MIFNDDTILDAYSQVPFQGHGIICHVTRSTRSLTTRTNVSLSNFFFRDVQLYRMNLVFKLR